MDSIRYLRPSEGWCSMELKLHYSSSSEKRRPGSQTMFTCMDTSYPRRNRRKNLHLECINRSIWTWHEAAQLDCLIVVTGMTRYFTFREQTTCLYAILPVNMEDFLHGWSMWGFKATLSINPPWVFFFFFTFPTVKTNLKQKDFKYVFIKGVAQRSHHVLILKIWFRTDVQLKKKKKDWRDIRRHSCG